MINSKIPQEVSRRYQEEDRNYSRREKEKRGEESGEEREREASGEKR